MFIPQTKDSEEGKMGEAELENAQETIEANRGGSKEQWLSKNKK